ncbi:sugar phosphate isomerase/epimerase [Paraflavitalea soli]|uniref:Sugar phosphate isomerase/epimerase n=1 Tax=Paraflavitalea soli TaxID=2315862 RepID=A0A3B7MEX0_9BACT|nr:sugar phosphate isomerase/epimerase family protein [Paraflavitalea soli]AXY72884.1 sugar phosphate isomerase/epimerase [Paraflavitalea soli]
MTSRRNFLQQSALGLAGTLTLPLASQAAIAPKAPAPLNTGIAGYTFAKFDLEKAIAMMKKVNINYISVKDFHLPLNSTDEKIQSVLKQFADAGIKIYAVGVIYMKSKEAVDQAFDYAKRVGVPLIVGVPNPELLDYTESVVKSSGIRLAIHNHGPEDKLYPSPKNAYDLIKDRDEKMGLCMDIGHAIRAGADPAAVVKQYKNRIFDLHIKDVSLAAKDGKAIEVGRGVIDFPALVKALRKSNYQGICSIEFEKDMTDPLAGLAESAGYFKGVVKSIG